MSKMNWSTTHIRQDMDENRLSSILDKCDKKQKIKETQRLKKLNVLKNDIEERLKSWKIPNKDARELEQGIKRLKSGLALTPFQSGIWSKHKPPKLR